MLGSETNSFWGLSRFPFDRRRQKKLERKAVPFNNAFLSFESPLDLGHYNLFSTLKEWHLFIKLIEDCNHAIRTKKDL
jgi:hypothetical protein